MTRTYQALANGWRSLALVAAAALALLALAACSDSEDATTSEATASTTESTASGAIVLSEVWARATAGNPGENSAVYAIVANSTDQDDTLIRVEVAGDVAARTEVHETVRVGDNMRMQELAGGLSVAAGGAATLEPGGLHVMLMEVASQLTPGQTFPAIFVFEHFGPVDVVVEVREMTSGAGGMGGMMTPTN